jgi:hypothetical protein
MVPQEKEKLLLSYVKYENALIIFLLGAVSYSSINLLMSKLKIFVGCLLQVSSDKTSCTQHIDGDKS